ncbi:MAG: hypothetical protein KDD34_08055, partial [Bdellovibrionales bacterium]|nr:hypothetical protein [Bdellovibrionales bacterium]
MTKVVLLTKSFAKKNIKKFLDRDYEYWYLSDDFLTLLDIKNKSGNYHIRTLGKEFYTLAEELKNDLLELSQSINLENCENEYFWGTQLASRSVTSGPLFRILIYLHFAQDLISKMEGKILIISDSLILNSFLAKASTLMGVRVENHMTFCEKFHGPRVWLKLLLRSIYFSCSYIYRWLLLRRLRNKRLTSDLKEGIYLLRSWVTQGNIGDDSSYKDRNFTELLDHLEKSKESVWILPMFFNLKRTFRQEVKLMSESKVNFLFPEQYLGF